MIYCYSGNILLFFFVFNTPNMICPLTIILIKVKRYAILYNPEGVSLFNSSQQDYNTVNLTPYFIT